MAKVSATLGTHPRAAFMTPREAEVLACVARGLTNKEIAAELGISESTVHCHLKAVKVRLRVRWL